MYGKTDQQRNLTNCIKNSLPTTSATRPGPQGTTTRLVTDYLRSSEVGCERVQRRSMGRRAAFGENKPKECLGGYTWPTWIEALQGDRMAEFG